MRANLSQGMRSFPTGDAHPPHSHPHLLQEMCLRLQISKKNNSRFCQFSSERVSKSNVNGLLLTEAKYINLSLHYLEQVIVALSEKNRSHIPYRNSMMTSVLRDSLGGNCMTTMIATCSVDKRNIEVNEN